MKIYHVIIQDEWNNLYHIGFYKNLKDSVEDINGFIESYGVSITPDDLCEYPSTFDTCFDLDLGVLFEDNEDVSGAMIRGFIFTNEYINNEIHSINEREET